MSLTRRAKFMVRRGLLRYGARMGSRGEQRIRTLHSYLELGAWVASRGEALPSDLPTREALFRLAADKVTGSRPLYLEFGVYQGASFRWWVENLAAPEGRFVGFDSFEGLPEDWNSGRGKGAFAVAAVPDVSDPRASFEVGWFDDTLPKFEVPEHDQLIVNVDSDLYTSAALVLDTLSPHLTPGTLIYFDELNDRDHELRALKEHLANSEHQVTTLGSSEGGVHWLFEVTA